MSLSVLTSDTDLGDDRDKWELYLDEANNYYYWYNEETGETKWDTGYEPEDDETIMSIYKSLSRSLSMTKLPMSHLSPNRKKSKKVIDPTVINKLFRKLLTNPDESIENTQKNTNNNDTENNEKIIYDYADEKSGRSTSEQERGEEESECVTPSCQRQRSFSFSSFSAGGQGKVISGWRWEYSRSGYTVPMSPRSQKKKKIIDPGVINKLFRKSLLTVVSKESKVHPDTVEKCEIVSSEQKKQDVEEDEGMRNIIQRQRSFSFSSYTPGGEEELVTSGLRWEENRRM